MGQRKDNQRQGESPRHVNAHGESRLDHRIQSKIRATVSQNAEMVNAGYGSCQNTAECCEVAQIFT